MPQAIPVIAQIVATYTASYLAYVATAVVLTFAFAELSKKQGNGKVPINLTIRSTIPSRNIVLGRRRVGGAVVYANTSGFNNKYLWQVVAYAGHQCNDLQDAWLDSRRIADADINGSTGAVADTSFDGKLRIWNHLGTGTQAADSNLDAEFTEWTSNHKLLGICYRVFCLERSDKAFPTGAPQSYSSLVEGALTYSARLDSTNGGAGAHRRDDPRTWDFSRNWARNLRWYLSGGSVVNDQATRLIMYGLKAPDARIDDDYTIAAENVSDESLSGANAPPSGAQERYTLDMEFLCTDDKKSVVEDMLIAGGFGQLVYLHGQWRIYAGAFDAAAHTFDEQDLFTDERGELPPVDIEDTTGDEDRFNQASGVYVDEERDHTEQTTPVRSNAAYVTQDAGKYLPRELALRGVTNQYRAQRIVELWLRKARQMRKGVFRYGRQGLAVAPWETIDMSHERYGWTNRIIRCVERDKEITSEGGVLAKITWQSESANVYEDLETADYTTGTSVTNALQSDDIDAPTGLTATSLPLAIEFTWELGEFWEQNGISELWEYTSDTPFASATRIWTGRGTRVIINKADFTTRYYWVRLSSIAGKVSSTEPASNGLAAVALPSLAISPDPQFALATDETFWWPDLEASSQLSTVPPAITLTGGAIAGKCTLTSDGHTSPTNFRAATIYSRMRSTYQVGSGQIFTIKMRWRKNFSTGGFTAALTAGAVRHNTDPTSSTFAPSTSIYGRGGALLGSTALDAATDNEWHEDSGILFFPRDPARVDADLPYVAAYGSFGAVFDSFVEIDYLLLEPGIGADPFIIEHTGAGTAYEMINNRYNSGAGGTLSLPAASSSLIGVKCYFEQIGTGLLTIAPAGGDTLKSPPNTTGNRALSGRYARAVAECDSSSSWVLTGDL